MYEAQTTSDHMWLPIVPRDKWVAPVADQILIVDDAADARLIMARSLEFEGYTCKQVSNAQEALASLRQEDHQLVVLDLMLPDIPGFDLLTTIRQQWSDIPVLIVSGLGEPAHIQQAIRLGAADYLVKPIMPDALAMKVSTLLGEERPNEYFAVNANLQARVTLDAVDYPCTIQAVSEVGLRLGGLAPTGDTLELHSDSLSRVLGDEEPVFLRHIGEDWYHYIGMSEARAEKLRARVIRGYFMSEHSLRQ